MHLAITGIFLIPLRINLRIPVKCKTIRAQVVHTYKHEMPSGMHTDTLDNLPYQFLKSTALLQVLCHIYQLHLDVLEDLRWHFGAGKKKTIHYCIQEAWNLPTPLMYQIHMLPTCSSAHLRGFSVPQHKTSSQRISKYNNLYNFLLYFKIIFV